MDDPQEREMSAKRKRNIIITPFNGDRANFAKYKSAVIDFVKNLLRQSPWTCQERSLKKPNLLEKTLSLFWRVVKANEAQVFAWQAPRKKTPWYATSKATGPTLKHQRLIPNRAFKYRDGACENCGAMGHTRKTCMEKPRAVGANIRTQTLLPMIMNCLDSRWQVHEEYERMEETRKLIKAQNTEDGIIDAEEKDDAER
uniref:Pre-mRNA-splicing factor SLU7 n=1 Tax=Ditylenchus dipsaci TaxID=166011 RepID=A0A915CTM8_9BILA